MSNVQQRMEALLEGGRNTMGVTADRGDQLKELEKGVEDILKQLEGYDELLFDILSDNSYMEKDRMKVGALRQKMTKAAALLGHVSTHLDEL